MIDRPPSGYNNMGINPLKGMYVPVVWHPWMGWMGYLEEIRHEKGVSKMAKPKGGKKGGKKKGGCK